MMKSFIYLATWYPNLLHYRILHSQVRFFKLAHMILCRNINPPINYNIIDWYSQIFFWISCQHFRVTYRILQQYWRIIYHNNDYCMIYARDINFVDPTVNFLHQQFLHHKFISIINSTFKHLMLGTYQRRDWSRNRHRTYVTEHPSTVHHVQKLRYSQYDL